MRPVSPGLTAHLRGRYIGFEGPIGAGKTTLSKLLAVYTKASLILEDVDGNEFLADFYRDKERWALPMQLWFLTARHGQLSETLKERQDFVGDYTFAKDAIFAGMLLQGRDRLLYERIAFGLRVLRRPDLVVYLDATDDVLLERIAHRGRVYETPIDAPYLSSVRKAYEAYLDSNQEANVLRVDTTHLDVSCGDSLGRLFDSIVRRLS